MTYNEDNIRRKSYRKYIRVVYIVIIFLHFLYIEYAQLMFESGT